MFTCYHTLVSLVPPDTLLVVVENLKHWNGRLDSMWQEMCAVYARVCAKELALAKKEFTKAAGPMPEPQQEFDLKSEHFFDWAIFYKQTLSQREALDFGKDAAHLREALFKSHRGLYRYEQAEQAGLVKVRDLLKQRWWGGGGVKRVYWPGVESVTRGQLFSARLVWPQALVTGLVLPGVCWHPAEAWAYAKGRVRGISRLRAGDGVKLLRLDALNWDLLCRYYRTQIYQHLSLREIYRA